MSKITRLFLVVFNLLVMNVKAQNPTILTVEKIDATSAAINLKNTEGFWHLSGPRSWESSNNFSIFWHDGSNYNGIMTLLSNGYVGLGVTNPLERFQISNAFLFHNGGHKILSFLYKPSGPGTDLDANSYASEIRFDPVNGYLRFGTSSTLVDAPITRLSISKEGKVGIGTLDTGNHRLAVEGTIGAREIKVEVGTWSDYVFKDGYNLPTLEEVERHIKEKGHLINIPSAQEVEENGVELGEMNKLLLEKIEELTLYVLELKSNSKKTNALMEKQDKRIKELEQRLKN
ncbi:hypothetical protein [Flagellimonas hadalis]|uniref:Uncharacterized protein n=1 Tax=Flagellimonas hadalis TaxID=2597517 RepID=A0A5N5IJT4_9FLAO|nr:hypothetical protein [Allomuricauda hadalis]KAB5483626.1 hypothetical protein FOT42_017640 [Allomuricauda hadalis]